MQLLISQATRIIVQPNFERRIKIEDGAWSMKSKEDCREASIMPRELPEPGTIKRQLLYVTSKRVVSNFTFTFRIWLLQPPVLLRPVRQGVVTTPMRCDHDVMP
jgi:hypothetical protein